MNRVQLLLVRLFDLAARYPITAAIILLLGFAACFLLMFSMRSESEQNRRAYEKQTKANQIAFAAALVEAETHKKRAEAAEANAALLKQQTDARASQQTAKDAELDRRITENQEKEETQKNELNQSYFNDLRRIDALPDADRAADICSRLNRLAGTNPALAAYAAECRAAATNPAATNR